MDQDKVSIPKDFFRELVFDFERLVHDLGLVIESKSQDYRQVIEDIDSLTRELEEITSECYMEESHKKISEIRKEQVKKLFDALLG
ncbi:MAG: hypothetical protein U9M95_00660 [Candidatus Altiarchaeota archaeon]|nr:hypothetical protein [Candidatus Altiarchaeota archaeon]